MVRRQGSPTVVGFPALAPSAVSARDGLEAAVSGSAAPDGMAVIFGLSVLSTLVVGGLVLAVSRSVVRGIEARIEGDPLNTGAIGAGALVGGFVVFAITIAVATLLVEFGAPAFVGLVPLLLTVAVSVVLTVASSIGVIVAGSVLLRGVGNRTEPNQWVALVVGTLAVHVLYLIPLLNVVVALGVVALATGGAIGHWRRGRRTDPPDSGPPEGSVNE